MPLEWFLLLGHPTLTQPAPSSLGCKDLASLCPDDSSSTYTVSSNFCQNLSPAQNSQAENKMSLPNRTEKFSPLLHSQIETYKEEGKLKKNGPGRNGNSKQLGMFSKSLDS